MGGKFAARGRGAADIEAFVGGIAAEHRAVFDVLRGLVRELAPAAQENLKWGTLQFDLNGSLFALSAPKGVVNFYILTVGVIARHRDLLAGIPQGKCVLRFAPGDALPIAALRTVMKAAVDAKQV